jgi:uncharacterized protein with von Willebrand factor type A (vWA) domain
MTNSFLSNIVTFLELLRASGFLLAPDEAAEVIQVMSKVNICDREQVRLAWMALLAKSQRQQRQFNQHFNDFFIGSEDHANQDEQAIQAEEPRQPIIEESREELGPDISEEVAEVYADAQGVRQNWMKNMLEVARSEKRNSELMEAYLNKMARGWLVASAGVGLKPMAEANSDDDDLIHKELSRISEDETARALHLIELIIAQLNRSLDRRHKRKGGRGLPDVRATIHASLRTGGIPMKPMYKKRPRAQRNLVLLCDVSESMLRFSGFALRFISGLARSSGKLRAFIFSEGVEEIGSYDYQTFTALVRASELWRLGTNIGEALGYLLDKRPPVLLANTTLVVLSDAWTVNRPLVLSNIERCSRQTRQIIWLNPDRTENDLVQELDKFSTMLNVGSLDDLVNASAAITL